MATFTCNQYSFTGRVWALFCSYLFIFSIDIHFLGADGLGDVVDVIFSAVIEDVLILFPESDTETETEGWREAGDGSVNLFFFFFFLEPPRSVQVLGRT